MSINVTSDSTGTTVEITPQPVPVYLDGDTNGTGIYLGQSEGREGPGDNEQLISGRFGRPVLLALGIEVPLLHGRAGGTSLRTGEDIYAHFWSRTFHISPAALAAIRAAAETADRLYGRWEDEACAVCLAAVLAFEAHGGRAPDVSESTFGDQRALLRRVPGGWETVSGPDRFAVVTRCVTT